MVIAIGPTMQRERGLLLEGCDCPVQDPLAVTIPGRDLGALLSKRCLRAGFVRCWSSVADFLGTAEQLPLVGTSSHRRRRLSVEEVA